MLCHILSYFAILVASVCFCHFFIYILLKPNVFLPFDLFNVYFDMDGRGVVIMTVMS